MQKERITVIEVSLVMDGSVLTTTHTDQTSAAKHIESQRQFADDHALSFGAVSTREIDITDWY